MKVAVLGCGPSGLAAAHAVRCADPAMQVDIVSMKVRSDPSGLQYLHAPIPGLRSAQERTSIKYVLKGSADYYRIRVYGPEWEGEVSPQRLPEEHRAWNLRSAYDELWELYEGRISDVQIMAGMVPQLCEAYDLVISSIPAPAICLTPSRHTFRSAEIIVGTGRSVEKAYGHLVAPGTVLCNGLAYPSWYRASNVFGQVSVEWPNSEMIPPLPGLVKVKKPMSTDCGCWQRASFGGRLMKVGRFGMWDKITLVHNVFDTVYERIRYLSR